MNGDLISRYALRKSVTDELERLHCVLYKYNEYYQATNKAFNTVLDFIDRAPTVEPEKALIANVTFDEDKLKEIVQAEVIDKIKNGELVLKAERPQGEWINEFYRFSCPFCKMSIDDEVHYLYPKEYEFNYCPNCGADMRKEEENDSSCNTV